MPELQLPPDGVAEPRLFLELWRQSSRDYRDAPAIESDGTLYSYGQIDSQSDQVAGCLARNGLGPGEVVAIGIARGKDLLVAMLGVMKSGAAFFLFEPDAPPARLSMQFGMARPGLVLVADAQDPAEHAAHGAPRVMSLDAVPDSPVEGFVGPDIASSSLAYIIFTSGSTGQPKGVLVPHRGIGNLARHSVTYGIGPGSRVLMFSPVCFDAIIAETVMTLHAGGCLVAVADEELKDFDRLQELLCHRRIDVATLPPSLVSLLPPDLALSLSTLVVAGERCSQDVIATWSGKTRLLNAYGPSEATVAATVKLCGADTSPANIGRALANVTVRVLNERMEPVGVDEVGEICISGVSVADGYLGLADLTAARFVGGGDGGHARVFRTGDYARLDRQGDILFEGRRDDLIKVNGNRIELAEIEACAMASAQVDACHACNAGGSGAPVSLALFFVPSGGADAAAVEAALRDRIARNLPQYFMPARFLALDALPRSPAGKVDRTALLERLKAEQAGAPAAPMNGREEALALLWSQILGRPVEDRDANFFALGGNSLLAMRLVALMKRSGFQVPLKRLFSAPTLSQMACLMGD
ncbi:non-ribosomal peptide synthetase [Pseudomonas sp. MSSRFD41]|uniref:non-ribosomal peptide synthetase n=1 Tax=Pseudomonas sp. MSSRFD41 TaxID=1310370 RepID=UPI00163969CB|nr:non-ribosomal peptide synthetase [Pseudomonas sp. MSSRFD41]MBC2656612.1 non-ribosomal peptide synthetase [Pseudomonas sp. MSSRFD41]